VLVDRAGFTPLAVTFAGSGNQYVLQVMARPRALAAFSQLHLGP